MSDSELIKDILSEISFSDKALYNRVKFLMKETERRVMEGARRQLLQEMVLLFNAHDMSEAVSLIKLTWEEGLEE